MTEPVKALSDRAKAVEIVKRNLRDTKYHMGLIDDIAAAIKSASRRGEIEGEVADAATIALTDVLERANATIAELTHERDEALAAFETCKEQMVLALQGRVAAEADNARLLVEIKELKNAG